MQLIEALEHWEKILPGRVLESIEAQNRYGQNTLGIQRNLLGALQPKTIFEIQQLLEVANRFHIPLYPISTGRNWGYGSALPAQEGCVIVDLSLLNAIRMEDPELGLITVEPGVTQQQLHEYLKDKGLPFWVPITGAGPTTSLVGNALERGYGLTPNIDHFAAVNRVEAILPNGKIYQTPLTHLGGATIDRAYKWGIGPYLDGLFSQGNLGIVTALTLQLARRAAHQETLLFNFNSLEEWIFFVEEVRDMMQSLGNQVTSFKVTNIPAKETENNKISQWFAGGNIYGDKPIVAAVKKVVKKRLEKKVNNLRFLNIERLKKRLTLQEKFYGHPWVHKFFPSPLQRIKYIEPWVALREGHPSEAALHFIYDRKKILLPKQRLNPDQDGCGIIWFAPLVPMLSHQVRIYIETVTRIKKEYKFSNDITFSCLSGACFDSTVPIVFDRENAEEVQRAHACYEALFLACQQHGFLPYRYPITFLKKIVDPQNSYWELVALFKQAADPQHILSPGRYSF